MIGKFVGDGTLLNNLIYGFLTGSLSQTDGIEIKPIIFTNIKTEEEIMIVHLGGELVGFPFLAHAGIYNYMKL